MSDLSDYTLPQLRKIASDNGIKLGKNRTTKEIRKLLQRQIDKGKLSLNVSKKLQEKIDIRTMNFRDWGPVYQQSIESFDGLPVEQKFEVMRTHWKIKGCGDLMFDVITGYPGIGGQSIHSYYNTEGIKEDKNGNKIDPREDETTGRVYTKQKRNIKELSKYLGISGKNTGLLDNQVVELLWWFVYGDYVFYPEVTPKRMTKALSMSDEDLEEILGRSGYEGRLDRASMSFAYATGSNVGETIGTGEDKVYRRVITADRTVIYEFVKIRNELFSLRAESPFRIMTRLIKKKYLPEGFVDDLLNMTLKNSNQYADKYGSLIDVTEIYPNVTEDGEDVKITTGFSSLMAYLALDLSNPTLDRLSSGKYEEMTTEDKNLFLDEEVIDALDNYSNEELSNSFGVDQNLAKYYVYEKQQETPSEYVGIKDGILYYAKISNTDWSYRVTNKGEGIYTFGDSRRRVEFKEKFFIDTFKKLRLTTKTLVPTKIKKRVRFSDNTTLDKYFTLSQIILLSTIIQQVNGSKDKEYYKTKSYETQIFKLANEYEKKIQRRENFELSYFDLDDVQKVYIINFLLWCINTGTKTFKRLKDVYNDLVDVSESDKFEGARKILSSLHLPVHIWKDNYLNKTVVNMLDYNTVSKMDNLKMISIGESYLSFIGYNKENIDAMLSHYRKS